MDKNEKKVTSLKGYWFTFVMFGFVGQLAWNIENMYFNTFLFNFIGGTTTDIANMVAASAIVATVTALFMGALSDKLNKRKLFICAGTILWGLSIFVFAFISRENVAFVMGNLSVIQVTSVTVAIVILMDCVMTFFGAMANDAAFTAWVTDVTDSTNRAKVEGVLSGLPMVAMLVVVAASGVLIDILGYPKFFIAIGILVTLSGVIGLFTLKESRDGIKTSDKYLDNVIYGFRPSVVKANKNLYILLVTYTIFNVAMNFYMPYFILYIEKFLEFDAVAYSLVLGVGILVSTIVGIVLGGFIDKYGKDKFMIPSISIYVVGLVATFFARELGILIFIVSLVLVGNTLITIILNSAIREYTPSDKVGLFQGIRMIFCVLIPMLVGPYMGNYIINLSSNTYQNEFGEIAIIPGPAIFLASAAFTLFMIIPLYKLKKNESKSKM